jgi:hypothetical protein
LRKSSAFLLKYENPATLFREFRTIFRWNALCGGILGDFRPYGVLNQHTPYRGKGAPMIKWYGWVGLAAAVVCPFGCRVHVHEDPPPRREVIVEERPARHEEVIIVQEAPPPPQKEVIIVRPSAAHVWINGYWSWDGHRHVWVAGRWVMPPRANQVWVEGRWERRGNGHVWIAGYWR